EIRELRLTKEDSAPTVSPQAEEEHQLLNAKVEEQYQTKVESASRYRVRLSGIVLLNLFKNRGVVDNPDFPSLVGARDPAEPTATFAGSLRQSMLGFEIFGPSIKNARVDADAQFDFAGASWVNSYESPVGLLRLRTGVVRLSWPKTILTAGQDVPFFSPLSPTSVATLAVPALSYSGNLWSWTPQARVDHTFDVTADTSFLLQAGILDPLTGQLPM